MKFKLLVALLTLILCMVPVIAKAGNLTIKVEDNKEVDVSVWNNDTFVNKTGTTLVFELPSGMYHVLIQYGSLSLLKRVNLTENVTLTINLTTTNNSSLLIKKIHTIIYPNNYLEVYEVLILQNKANKIFFGDVQIPLPQHRRFEMLKSTAKFENYIIQNNNLVITNTTILPNSTAEIMFSYTMNSNNFSRRVDSISETLILVNGASKVKRSPFLISQGVEQFDGEIFEVLTANLSGENSYYVLMAENKQTANVNLAVILGIVIFSIGIILFVLDRGKEWEIENK
ncbi:hypothetical protein DRP05_00025 [Archaeoglobales archaeon]|nr:MAG: hypothetical protein DRP05_00025 [Archaeoglobales archaeon]